MKGKGIKVKNIRAYDKYCIGCQRHGAHIMISYVNEDNTITDLFLDESQSKSLLEELNKCHEQN